ncbi:aspartate/glutamate racemase family protein [Siccirubricoccus deserti]
MVRPSDPGPERRPAGGRRGPLPALLHGLRGLEAAGAGAIAIPCNTAHGWFDEMQAATSLPILHIVDAAAAELARLGVRAGPIGVMGTTGTLAMRLYQDRLADRGYECLVPEPEEMARQVTPAIGLVKANRVAEAYGPLAEVAAALMARGARAVVLGCTEIPLGIAAGPALPSRWPAPSMPWRASPSIGRGAEAAKDAILERAECCVQASDGGTPSA